VQSLLLEGGPTLATSFLAAGLVDKLLLFIAPRISGSGPRFVADFAGPLDVVHQTAERAGDDVLLAAYLREP
jgi:diaminohydroxyphosphoribosylaminopyrimidine deaminase / 5-amino-6-(5-phosphoribosylamino)uracil reductase